MISSAVSMALDEALLPLDAPKSRGIMLSINAENSLLNRSKLSKSVVVVVVGIGIMNVVALVHQLGRDVERFVGNTR
jgi:hypothetical protein